MIKMTEIRKLTTKELRHELAKIKTVLRERELNESKEEAK